MRRRLLDAVPTSSTGIASWRGRAAYLALNADRSFGTELVKITSTEYVCFSDENGTDDWTTRETSGAAMDGPAPNATPGITFW